MATQSEWALTTRAELAMRNVAPRVIEELLQQAMTLVEQSGEPAQDLFSPPEEWVEEQIEARRAQGLPVFAVDTTFHWRELPMLACVTASVVSALLLVAMLFDRERTITYGPGTVALPAVIGIAAIAVPSTFNSLTARRSVVTAAGGAFLVTATLVALLVPMFVFSDALPSREASIWWFLPVAVAYAVAAWALAGLVQDHGPRPWTAPVGDDEWAQQVARHLRVELAMPENRVRQVVAEARLLAHDAGTTLHEEFGRPEDYAATFTRDEGRASLRLAWPLTLGALLLTGLTFGSLLAGDEVVWYDWVMPAFLAIAAGTRWSRYAKTRTCSALP